MTNLITTVLLAAGCSVEPSTDVAADRSAGREVHSGVLEGVVTDSSGQTLAGAFVN